MAKVAILNGTPVPAQPRHPDSFSQEPVGRLFESGTRFWKVTDPSTPGNGHYFLARLPSGVSESIHRRLALPTSNLASEARLIELTAPAVGNCGPINRSTSDEPQVEFPDEPLCKVVGRWHISTDLEKRLEHGLEGGLVGLGAGAAMAAYTGNPWWLFLALVGFIIGMIFPTDLEELSSLLWGVVPTVLLLP